MSAVAEAVQTSAPEPDLFGPAPLALHASCKLQLIGTVAHQAEVRSKPLDGQHYVPVVCVDIENVGPGHNTIHAEHPFTEATRHEAELLARRLHKGATVIATTGLSDIRVYLPAATLAIHHPT
jgi:hypothetical protein